MELLFYFGPEKVSFQLSEDGVVESLSAIPFHGIISRGLLQRFIEFNIESTLWFSNAHRLFDKNLKAPEETLQVLREHAIQSKVLSFDNSANVVKKYVLTYCEKYSKKSIETIECWNIKEGHTSSVWKVTLKGEKKSESFVLNVARDFEAGKELKQSSEKLKLVGVQIPSVNCAKVYEVVTIEDEMLPAPVIVTRNELVKDSFEIHTRNNMTTKKQEFLLVERFLTNADNPSQITSVLGRLFSSKETKKIEKEIKNFITKATSALKEELQVSINDGDVVWDGKKAIIVAIN